MENRDGVVIETGRFGEVSGVEHPSDEPPTWWSTYFDQFVEYMENYGYVRDHNIRGAPYDFRYITTEPYLSYYFQNLTNEIETLYNTHHRKVILMSHSMGGSLTLKFLETKSLSWKNKYIKNWISISASLAGSFGSLFGFLFGDPSGSWELGPDAPIELLLASFPTTQYLFPSSSYFDENKLLFKTQSEIYTIKNMTDLVRANNPMAYNLMSRLQIPEIWSNISVDVPFTCILSTGIPTVTSGNLYNATVLVGVESEGRLFGDGTLTKDELESCYQLVDKNKRFTSSIYNFRNINHNDILSNRRVMALLRHLVNKFS